MGKLKRLTCILLAVVLVIGSFPLAASAAHSSYFNDAISYNSIDKAELSTAQKASYILDIVDNMLTEKNIQLDIPILGEVNLTSIDSALSSVYGITGNLLFINQIVGDLTVLKTYRSIISSCRRTTDGITDVDLIGSIVTYVGDCAPKLAKVINNNFNWGIVKSAFPNEAQLFFSDFHKYIIETVWIALHPVNSEVMPDETTLDSLVQFVLDNQVGGKRVEVMGFEGLLPGFDLNINTDNGYRVINELLFGVYNNYFVPFLNGEVRDFIYGIVMDNFRKDEKLCRIINPYYTVLEYEFDRNMSFFAQLNSALGQAVYNMVITESYRWIDSTNEVDCASVLEDNLTYFLKQCVVAVNTTTDFSNYSLADLVGYILADISKYFIDYISYPENVSIGEFVYLSLREQCVNLVPELTYADGSLNRSVSGYRDSIIEIFSVLATYYLNDVLALNITIEEDSGKLLSALANWCMEYCDGFFDRTAYDLAVADSSKTGWDEIDAIIWELIPKDWFPYELMFADESGKGEADDLTLRSFINYILDAILNADLDALQLLFSSYPESILNTQTARQTIIGLIVESFNALFSVEDIWIPPVVSSFEDFISPTSNLVFLIQEGLVGLKEKQDILIPVAINIIAEFIGAEKEQSVNEPVIKVDERVYCENGLIPETQKIRISNIPSGVNSAWRNTEGKIVQDGLYCFELVSLTTSTSDVQVDFAESNYSLVPNCYIDLTVFGSIAEDTEVRFDLIYYICDAAGNRIGPSQSQSAYSNFYVIKGIDEMLSEAFPQTNRVSFAEFPTYYFTTDVRNLSCFSLLATNHGSVLLNQEKVVRRVIITGTPPFGVTPNDPENGYIAYLDKPSLAQNTFATVHPYNVDFEINDSQPYGIYPLSISFEICDPTSDTGVITVTREHVIVIYNDYGLPDLLEKEMNKNRQRSHYAADADVEWVNYLSALDNAFDLVQGPPKVERMFFGTPNDNTTNAYMECVSLLETAISQLDAKVKANSETLLSNLKKLLTQQTSINEQENYFGVADYMLFTYLRWNKWREKAEKIINSSMFISDFEISYTQHMLELMYPRMIRKTASIKYLIEAYKSFASLDSALYTEDTWADFSEAMSNASLLIYAVSDDFNQTKVNDARKDLLRAVKNLRMKYILPAESTATVVDSRQMFIYGIYPTITEIDPYITTISDEYTISVSYKHSGNVGTGAVVKVWGSNHMNDTVNLATYLVVIYGDLNSDGWLNEDDLDAYDLYLSGNVNTALFYEGSPFSEAADLNKDGIIDQKDRDRFVAYLDGKTINQVDPRLVYVP